jgi:hypothetical protein
MAGCGDLLGVLLEQGLSPSARGRLVAGPDLQAGVVEEIHRSLGVRL